MERDSSRARRPLRAFAIARARKAVIAIELATIPRMTSTFSMSVYIVSGASTPIKSRQRAITERVAVQRPRRKASVSEPSTLWWW